MRAVDVIIKKREGEHLTAEEIEFLIREYTRDGIPDYQMAAFLMAVYFQGMGSREICSLVQAMLHSGQTLDFGSDFLVDKHSTGGVGDKSSIALMPAVVACGLKVPMMTGRGLGHSGGTADKLESIAGFTPMLSLERFRNQVLELGGAFTVQTCEIVPADKKIYALRDVTGTVESIPLITSSILSKKLAEGISGLVLDVKFGSGAFMRRAGDAEALAQMMVQTGRAMGKQVVARLSNMNQPIGHACGNALEIQESIEVMQGQGPEDLVEQIVELGAEMLCLAGEASHEQARHRVQEVLNNGKALQKFIEIIRAQGGDVSLIEHPERLPQAPRKIPILARRSGHVESMDTRALGNAVVVMGGGRSKADDVIDPRVGLVMRVRLGDAVREGQELCVLHVADQKEEEAKSIVEHAFSYSDFPIMHQALWGIRIGE